MKRQTFIFASLLSLFVLLLASGCKEDTCVVGSGTTEDYPLNLGVFHSIDVSGESDLILSQDSFIDLVITAEPEIFAVTTRGVANEVLEIGLENGVCIETSKGIQVKTTVPDYQKIIVSGISRIVSDGALNEDAMEIRSSGDVNSLLTGDIKLQILDASGVLNVRHFNVNSDVVNINISGSADIEVRAEKELNLNISGAATVRYKGSPVINQSVSGTLELIDAN